MSVQVEEAASGRQMRDFIRLPLRLYPEHSNFVPHLLRERREFFSSENPLFQFTDVCYLLARDDSGRAVGRLTAHVNHRYNDYWGEKTGFFGFLETVERPEVAEALLAEAERRLADRGMRRVRGPFSFSTNQECALLVEGFDEEPAFMMPYNPPFYPDYLERCGYDRAKDLLAYSYDSGGDVPPRLSRFARKAQERTDVSVRPVDPDRFRHDVARAFSVYNRAWSRNWGFVPMTEEQFEFMAESLRPVVEPELALIAELDGEPVGFSLALPDYNRVLKRMNGRLFPFGIFRFFFGRRRIDSVRVLTMGVVREHRRSGIDVLLIHRTFVNGIENGFTRGEFSWVLEDNVLLRRTLERMGARVSKTYRIFEKSL
ncbi:MAG: N-acetyltransferase [Planctomycetota bacterium]